MKKLFTLLLSTIVIFHQGSSQCIFDVPTEIVDNDTTSVSIIISGAEQNDLSLDNQGVCAVNVSLNHIFIGDIFVELVSPIGERVRLMGPAVDVSPLTTFVTWSVQFNGCEFPVFPDAGYEPVWDNLQTWFGGTEYTGTYYPYEGCLEDLDMGPVNGEWKLEFIDQSMFGTGMLNSFEIFFCNTAGITCNFCEPGEHDLEGLGGTFCQYDPTLMLFIEEVFTSNEPSTELYNYGYVAFNTDTMYQVLNEPDLTDFDAGSYLICGLSYQSVDSLELFSLEPGEAFETWETYLEAEDICGSLSSNCVSIDITPSAELVILSEEICPGDSVIIAGQSYFETGTYTIVTEVDGCDSISRLELLVSPNPYPLLAGLDSLTCKNYESAIVAEDMPDDVSIMWSTVDGLITSSTDTRDIFVTKPGTYTAVITDDICTYEESITIHEGGDFLYIDILTDTITCTNDTIPVILVGDVVFENVAWTSTETFIVDGDDILVTEGGLYTVEVTGNGCITNRDVVVLANDTLPEFEVLTDTLSCLKTSGSIGIVPADGLSYEYSWSQGSTVLGSESTLEVATAGVYTGQVSAENGCVEIFQVAVPSLDEAVELTFSSDTITCLTPSVELSFTSNYAFEDLAIFWTNPDLLNFNSPSLQTSVSGEYLLSLEAPGGCTLDTMITIIEDTSPPNINILQAEFGCAEDSIRLSLFGVGLEDEVVWSGPLFSSTEEDPWIFQQGTYIANVTGVNGCTSADTVVVGANMETPAVQFETESFDCDTDTVVIMPNDLITYEYTWTLTDGMTMVTMDSLVVTTPGLYKVDVLDVINGCRSKYQLSISENFVDTLTSLTADTINCEKSVANIDIQSFNELSEYVWYDVNGDTLTTTTLEPALSDPGLYRLVYTMSNGCEGQDSIEIFQSTDIPTITVDDNFIDCNKLEATLEPSIDMDDYELQWLYPNNVLAFEDVITTSLAGVYEVVVTVEGNCRDTAYVEVVGDTLGPIPTFALDGNITCTDSMVMISMDLDKAHTSITWSGPEGPIAGELSIEVTEPGFYSVTNIGENGCTYTDSVEVVSGVVIPSYEILNNTIECDSMNVSAGIDPSSDDYTIIWDDSSLTNFTNSISIAGTYLFEVTNIEGCTVLDSITVTVDTLTPMPMVAMSNDLNCTFSEATLAITNAVDGEMYTWSGPGISGVNDETIFISEGGIYTLFAEAENGCTQVQEFDIEQDLVSPDIEVLGDTITCDAGKSILSVISSLDVETYNWSGPGDFMSDNPETIIFFEGTYYVTITAANGCTASDSIEILDVQVFPEIAVDDYYLPCDGSSIEIGPTLLSPDTEVRWLGPGSIFAESPLLTTNVEGQYFAQAINSDGCASVDTFLVIDEAVPPIFDYLSDSLYCFGDVILTATDVDDDLSVTWLGPEGVILAGASVGASLPGLYDLIVVGANMCADTIAVEVPDARTEPVAVVTLISAFQCLTEEVELSAEGSSEGNNITYEWTTQDGVIVSNGNSKIVSVLGEGTYTLEVTDNRTGCSTLFPYLLLKDEQSFSDIIFDITPPTCEGFANAFITFEFDGGFAPYLVEVDGNSYGEKDTIEYLYAGEHIVVITDSVGCALERVVRIEEGDYPEVIFPADTILQFGDVIEIAPEIFPDMGDLIMQWGEPSPCDGCRDFEVQPFDNVYYTLTVTDKNGCSDTDDFLIKVNDANLCQLPNIFSPNGDGANEWYFMPYVKGIETINSFKIYDWNGALMFAKQDVKPGIDVDGWNGTFEGQQALAGVYLYEISMTLINGTVITKVGDLTLIR